MKFESCTEYMNKSVKIVIFRKNYGMKGGFLQGVRKVHQRNQKRDSLGAIRAYLVVIILKLNLLL